MADLTTLDSAQPAGSETPTQGDDRERETRDKTKGSFNLEHYLDGKHKIPILASLPAFGSAGRLVWKQTSGVADELWGDTGSAWTKLTTNQQMIDYIASLATHAAVNPIDHPNNSIDYLKIIAGAIRKKHLDGGTDNASINNLVNGGNADNLHYHGGGGTGYWTSVSVNTIYQATTDGMVVGFSEIASGIGGIEIHIKSDSTSPPTTRRAAYIREIPTLSNPYTAQASLMCPIPKNDYWIIDSSVTNNYFYWIPWGRF